MGDEDFVGIPENADLYLFAEDLITHILNRELSEREVVHTVEEFRDFLYNAFDETMADAVDLLLNQSCIKPYVLPGYPQISEVVFFTLASICRQHYFPHGFDARMFLYYCVHIGSFAVFLRKNNFFEAPMLGVKSIVDTLDQFDMSKGGWDVLRNVASEFSKMYLEYRINTGGRADMNEDYTLRHLQNPDFFSTTMNWKHHVFYIINSCSRYRETD